MKSKKKILVRQKVCRCCGEIFETQGYNSKYCPECRELESVEGVKVRKDANKQLIADTARIERYNKKHGTRLSYGQYKLLCFFGRVKR